MGHNSTKSIQVIVEAERRAYADRNYLGDWLCKMPLNALMDDNYLKQEWLISVLTGHSSSEISRKNVTYNMETTHYSIVDQFGNAIAATTTLNAGYGSKYYWWLGLFFE
jgi:gamma-glutamyltranspeptidase/glutathione hydrolase